MRTNLFLLFIFLSFAFEAASQNIYQIKIEEISDPGGIPSICISSCADCGKLYFTTYLSGLTFESQMGNIVERKVDRQLTEDGYEKFKYQIVTKAAKIQNIIIKGPSLADFKLTVKELEPASCQNFIIKTLSPEIDHNEDNETENGSLLLKSTPSGASFTISGEPKTNNVTPFLIKNHKNGTYNMKLEKTDYYPVDTTITFVDGEKLEMNINLTKKPSIDLEKLRAEIRSHSNKQTFFLVSTLVSAGAGGYFLYESNQKYNEYLNSANSRAADLRKTVDLYDKLVPVFFGLAGACAIEFTIQTIKKGKCKEKLKLYTNGNGLALSYKF